jgi:hypothetical protein
LLDALSSILSFDSEVAKPGILGFIHHTDPADTEHLDDAVMRDGPADHGKIL